MEDAEPIAGLLHLYRRRSPWENYVGLPIAQIVGLNRRVPKQRIVLKNGLLKFTTLPVAHVGIEAFLPLSKPCPCIIVIAVVVPIALLNGKLLNVLLLRLQLLRLQPESFSFCLGLRLIELCLDFIEVVLAAINTNECLILTRTPSAGVLVEDIKKSKVNNLRLHSILKNSPSLSPQVFQVTFFHYCDPLNCFMVSAAPLVSMYCFLSSFDMVSHRPAKY